MNNYVLCLICLAALIGTSSCEVGDEPELSQEAELNALTAQGPCSDGLYRLEAESGHRFNGGFDRRPMGGTNSGLGLRGLAGGKVAYHATGLSQAHVVWLRVRHTGRIRFTQIKNIRSRREEYGRLHGS